MSSCRFNSKKRKRLKNANIKRQKQKIRRSEFVSRDIAFIDLKRYYLALTTDERELLDYQMSTNNELYRLSQENGYIIKKIHAWQLGKRLSSWWLVEWVGYDNELYWGPDFNVKNATDYIDDFIATSFCENKKIANFWNRNK